MGGSWEPDQERTSQFYALIDVVSGSDSKSPLSSSAPAPSIMLTHPVRVMVQDSASGSIQLLVPRGGSGLRVLPVRTLRTAGKQEEKEMNWGFSEMEVFVTHNSKEVNTGKDFLFSHCTCITRLLNEIKRQLSDPTIHNATAPCPQPPESTEPGRGQDRSHPRVVEQSTSSKHLWSPGA